jgi:hypothetical protein
MGVEGVERQIVERCKQPKVFWIDPMDKRSASSADGAITDADMIQVSFDLESHAPAMTGSLV